MTTKEKIKEKNALWDTTTPNQKRVLIAKDVIARIKSNQYIANKGLWITIKDCHRLEGSSLQVELLRDDSDIQCRVCALGGIMTSLASFKNNIIIERDGISAFEFSDLKDGSIDDVNNFIGLFGQKQLAMIEIAYEGEDGYHNFYKESEVEYFNEQKSVNNMFTEAQYTRYVLFSKKFESNAERLTAIMQNIVDNHGFFKI